MATVVVTDGDNRSGLAVCRSLSAKGIRVVAVTRHLDCLASRSRSVARAVVGPHPATAPDQFTQFVAQLARSEGASLVVPISDQALIAINSRRQAFDGVAPLAMAAQEAVRAVVDKRRNLDLAAELGLPVPREYRLENRAQLDDLIAQLGWPVVLKRPGDPADPLVPKFDLRVLFAHDRAQLESYLDVYCAEGRYPLFQECARGKAVNVVCFAARGKLLAAHQYQSIRTWSGSGVLRRVIPAEPDLAAHAERILKALSWEGVAHVGFFVDRAAGRTWYMEVNGRFWASVQGSVYAGWDFPGWTWDYFVEGRPPEPPALQVGSTTCWYMGDFVALVEFLRGGVCPSPGKQQTRLRAVLDWAAAYSPGVHSEIFRWSDPGPGLIEIKNYLHDQRARLLRRGRGAAPASTGVRS